MSEEETISAAELDERARDLEDLQTEYEKISFLGTPKMPCPECAGGGSVDAGSLGNICLGCMGARVVDRPFTKPPKLPDFPALRAGISNYRNALEKGLALPPASSVVSEEELEELRTKGEGIVQQQLEATEEAKRLSSGDADY